VFSGSLSSKKVGELWDIAYSLGLEEEGMTKATLTSLIKAHFNMCPDLKDQP
jgi:hypothetical protein